MNKRRSSWSPWITLAILISSGLFSLWQARPDGRFHLWVFDVGQGDAIFIQTPDRHQILLDGGPDDRVLVELGKHMPFWDRSIDLVILSHPHTDHLTGLIDVARRYQIGQVWMSGALHTTPEFASWLAVLADRHISNLPVWAGKTIDLDTAHLEVIYPLSDQTAVRPTNQHDATVVVKLTTADDHAALLTGDLETEQEAKIVAADCPDQVRPCAKLHANLLKVPHHGSKTGLEPDFLAAIAPQDAIISCGQRNPYGHPHALTLERLVAAHIPIWRTDTEGTIEATLAQQGQWRLTASR